MFQWESVYYTNDIYIIIVFRSNVSNWLFFKNSHLTS